jgi:hypothetical protein
MVDPLHRSWADNSTGPYGENTEEAEVRLANQSIHFLIMFAVPAHTSIKSYGNLVSQLSFPIDYLRPPFRPLIKIFGQ